MIPPSINFDIENQDMYRSQKKKLKVSNPTGLDVDCLQGINSRQVSREFQAWLSDGVRRASLNSFGYGGTNANVIHDAYQDEIRASNTRCQQNHQSTKMLIPNS